MATILTSGNALFSKPFSFVPSLSHGHKPSSMVTFANYTNNANKMNVQTVWDSSKETKIDETGFQQNLGGNAVHSRKTMKSYDKNVVIGVDYIENGSRGLEEFVLSYFMFHGFDSSDTRLVFKYLPVLLFTESCVSQADQMNEKLLQLGGKYEGETQLGSFSCSINDPFGPLKIFLEHKGLLTERIRQPLKDAEEYWALERKLCYALNNNEEILVEDVIRANHLRVFDFRLMNLLLYQMRGSKVDELHMKFLSASEFLMDIWDDCYDYERDVLRNTFNVFRLFVKIYGASAAPNMMMECINEFEGEYKRLLKTLDPQLAESYQNIVDSPKEDGIYFRHPVGNWTIPAVIEDEESYRSEFKSKAQ